jgi:hypothetical protein
MGKTYDGLLKQIIDQCPDDWSGFLSGAVKLPAGAVLKPLDSDLSMVFSIQSDKLFQVLGTGKGLVHLELIAAWTEDAAGTCLAYNIAARKRYGGPVRSVVVLLRREAYSSDLTGELSESDEKGQMLWFRFHVIKLWEQPLEAFLHGPLGTLPLAVLTDEAKPQLPKLIAQIDHRIQTESSSKKIAEELINGCALLMGLRYNQDEISKLFRGVKGMRESAYYQMILAEGREEGIDEGVGRGQIQNTIVTIE